MDTLNFIAMLTGYAIGGTAVVGFVLVMVAEGCFAFRDWLDRSLEGE
jgi:hypothetical protein